MSLFGDLAKGITGGLLDKVAPQVGKYFREKQEQNHAIEMKKLEGKLEWEKQKTLRAERSEGRDHEWEMASLAAHSKTWKDEWVLIVLSVPAIMAFTPWAHYVHDGFSALQATPIWYQGILGAVFLAVYGIRYMRRGVKEKDLMQKFHELEMQRVQTQKNGARLGAPNSQP